MKIIVCGFNKEQFELDLAPDATIYTLRDELQFQVKEYWYKFQIIFTAMIYIRDNKTVALDASIAIDETASEPIIEFLRKTKGYPALQHGDLSAVTIKLEPGQPQHKKTRFNPKGLTLKELGETDPQNELFIYFSGQGPTLNEQLSALGVQHDHLLPRLRGSYLPGADLALPPPLVKEDPFVVLDETQVTDAFAFCHFAFKDSPDKKADISANDPVLQSDKVFRKYIPNLAMVAEVFEVLKYRQHLAKLQQQRVDHKTTADTTTNGKTAKTSSTTKLATIKTATSSASPDAPDPFAFLMNKQKFLKRALKKQSAAQTQAVSKCMAKKGTQLTTIKELPPLKSTSSACTPALTGITATTETKVIKTF